MNNVDVFKNLNKDQLQPYIKVATVNVYHKKDYGALPATLKTYLGSLDKTSYSDEQIENAKWFSLQKTKDGEYDIYPILDFENKYEVVSEGVCKENILSLDNKSIIQARKISVVTMVNFSTLGIPIDQEFTMEAPWGGTQTKPKGADAYFVYSDGYMVQQDTNGLPIGYIKAKHH